MDSIETLRNFHTRKARRQQQQAREQRESYESMLPDLVSSILEQDPEVELVVLFGSLAGNPSGYVHDIDIALRSKRLMRVAAWLLSQTPKIDAVDIDELYPIVKSGFLRRERFYMQESNTDLSLLIAELKADLDAL